LRAAGGGGCRLNLLAARARPRGIDARRTTDVRITRAVRRCCLAPATPTPVTAPSLSPSTLVDVVGNDGGVRVTSTEV